MSWLSRNVGQRGYMALGLILAACGPAVQRMSAAIQMQANALKLKGIQPPPAWRSNLGEHGADLVMDLGDRILVGTMYGEPSYYTRSFGGAAPHYGPLLMLDANSGRPVWRKVRRDLPTDVVAVEPVIVLRSLDQNGAVIFEGVEPKTGVTLWTRTAQSDQAFTTTHSPAQLVIAAKSGKDIVAVQAIGLEDGLARWSRRMSIARAQGIEAQGAAGPSGGAAMLLQSGSILVVVGDSLTGLETASGEERWTAALPGQFTEATKAVVDAANLYLGTGSNLALLSLRDGKVSWLHAIESEPLLLNPTSDAVLAISSADHGGVIVYILHAFDPKSGRLLWSHTMSAPINSVLLSTPKVVYYTTALGLVGVNMATGAKIFDQPFEVAETLEALPDLLRLRGENVVVARESGIAAFSAQSGAPVWAISDFGGEDYTTDHARKGKQRAARAAQFLLSANPALKPKAPTGPGIGATMPALKLSTPAYVQMAQEHWRSTQASPTSTAGERMRAADYAEHTITSYQSSLRTQATIGAVGAGVAAGVEVFGAAYAAYKTKQLFETVAQRWAIAEAQAGVFHFNSIAGEFGFRPFRRPEGTGLMIVDLDSGGQSDLYLTPAPGPLTFISTLDLQPPLYCVAGDRQTLYVVGTGLNPTQVPDYLWRVGYTEWEVPYPGILSYDLRQLHFVDQRSVRIEHEKAKQAQDRKVALLTAIVKHDLVTATELLKTGVDPNFESTTQLTPPLVHAVGGHHTDAVKLLLDYGADPNIASFGLPIVEVAQRQGDSEIVRLLNQARSERTRHSASPKGRNDN